MEKKKLWALRIISGVLFAALLAVTAVVGIGDFAIFIPLIIFTLIFFVVFVESLLSSYKNYEYGEDIITIYAGIYRRYVKVNGVLQDEHNTLYIYTPINMTAKLTDGSDAFVTVSTMNRITLKIGGQLIKPVKKK